MKRGKDGQIEIPAWRSKVLGVYIVEVETRHSCAVVASDSLPGAAVLNPSPRLDFETFGFQQGGSDAHKSNPLLNKAGTCHVNHELQNE